MAFIYDGPDPETAYKEYLKRSEKCEILAQRRPLFQNHEFSVKFDDIFGDQYSNLRNSYCGPLLRAMVTWVEDNAFQAWKIVSWKNARERHVSFWFEDKAEYQAFVDKWKDKVEDDYVDLELLAGLLSSLMHHAGLKSLPWEKAMLYLWFINYHYQKKHGKTLLSGINLWTCNGPVIHSLNTISLYENWDNHPWQKCFDKEHDGKGNHSLILKRFSNSLNANQLEIVLDVASFATDEEDCLDSFHIPEWNGVSVYNPLISLN